MADVLDRMAKADVWVLATSCNWGAPESLMQGFIERLLPLVEPVIEISKKKVKYKLREGVMPGKIVLVSASPKWNLDVFDPLVVQLKMLSQDANREFAGALLRPHAPALRHMMDIGKETAHILDAAKEAGRAFVKNGSIFNNLAKVVSSELMPQAVYIRHLNAEFAKALEENTKQQDVAPDDKLQIETQPHPFKFKSVKDRELASSIVETLNLMGGIGPTAENYYQKSLKTLRSKSEMAVKIIAQEYKGLREAGYLDRWSLVHLLGELQDPSALDTLDKIVRSRIPKEKSKVLHEYSTRAEELMIRTTAIESIKRIAINKSSKAVEILLVHTKHSEFSVRREAVQSFLEVGGRDARKKLLEVLPKKYHDLLDIRRIDVRKAYQPVIFDRTEPVNKKGTVPPINADKKRVLKKSLRSDPPTIYGQENIAQDKDSDKPSCD
jgi:hypothetical protein